MFIFARAFINFDARPEGKDHFIAPEYGCITPLRMLRLKQTQPHTWDRLSLLMDHDAERKQETEYQRMFQVGRITLAYYKNVRYRKLKKANCP